ncbi:MAG: hypothetical protein HY784_09575 [Chloroflexi bacterium]|nr:hypothetical protein [Chloroflexota bacterium]
MDTIVLQPTVREMLEKDAEQEERSMSEIVNEAIEQYLLERQRAKLEREIEAYEAMHTELRRQHFEQWVAIHEQRLVDHDADRAALYRRVRTRYGRTPVLIRQVGEQPAEDIWIRTPSTGKIE